MVEKGATMNVSINGKGLHVGEELRQRIETKLGKFDRYFGEDAEAQVKVRPEGEEKCIEITIRVTKHLYRSEAIAEDVFTALDQAMAGMERQIRKQKSKIEKKIRDFAYMKEALRQQAEFVEAPAEEGQIIKKKSFDLTSANPEEAALQMELLGHNFHLFLHGETGKVALVYKRKDGNYGLIEPEY